MKRKIIQWLLNFLLVQLFITLFSWPILLSWGLAITPLSIIGNLVFSPFLSLFLILCTCSVTLELLTIPHGAVLHALEYLTDLWLWLIQLAPKTGCTFTWQQPPLFIALLMPLVAISIIMNRRFIKTTSKILALSASFVCFSIILSLQRTPATVQVAYGTHTLTLKKEGKNIICIDGGFIRRTKHIEQWVQYTLLPELARNFGTQKIDEYRIEKQSPSAQRCKEVLCKKGILVKK